MELTVAIVTAVAGLLGMGLKIWLQRNSVKAAEAETAKWTALAAAATKENIKLRQLLANKEVALAAAQAALDSKMSASELAAALTELFGGQHSPAPAPTPGDSLPKAG